MKIAQSLSAQSCSRLWIFSGIFVLLFYSAVWGVDTRAQESCVLYVENAALAAAAGWAERGFSIRERPDLPRLNEVTIAALLDESHFIWRASGGDTQIWMNLSPGEFKPNWRPLRLKGPPSHGPIAVEFSCAQLRAQFQYLRRTRTAIELSFDLVDHRKIAPTRGEVILDLEQHYFDGRGIGGYAAGVSKGLYRDLLAKIRPLAKATSANEFFENWKQVRDLVYGKGGGLGIDYCDEKASMSAALQQRCTNCVGETYLLTALFQDAGFQPPEGWVIKAQAFRDHLRPILVQTALGRTFDLATGGMGQLRAAIFDIDSLYRALWRGGIGLRFAGESAAMATRSPEYLYQAWGCLVPGIILQPALQPSNFSDYSACDHFVAGKNPHRASNAVKTKQTSFEETDAKSSAAGNDPATKGQEPQDKSAQSGAEAQKDSPEGAGQDRLVGWGRKFIEGLKQGLGRSHRWFGTWTSNVVDSDALFNSDQDRLRRVADNLIPVERAAILKSLEQMEFNDQMRAAFSFQSFAAGFGLSHLTLFIGRKVFGTRGPGTP